MEVLVTVVFSLDQQTNVTFFFFFFFLFFFKLVVFFIQGTAGNKTNEIKWSTGLIVVVLLLFGCGMG